MEEVFTMISVQRLKRQFDTLRGISASSTGINRLAFSDKDWEGRSYIASLMEEAGLSVRSDAFGNVIGHFGGRDETLPPILFGSHGDSVPEGGNYDGIVGILGAIETVRSMKEDGFIPDHPLEVVLFMCEESSRFSAATLGSRAMRGALSASDLLRLHDHEGSSLYAVLKQRGLDPEQIESARYDKKIKAFLELHIEQGKVLEHKGKQIGIVTGIAAPSRLICKIHGSADHSGATPMNLRRDGLCAAAEVILAVEKAAKAKENPPVVATVGIAEVTPCVMNVIPGEVRLGIDIRSIDSASREDAETSIRSAIESITKKRGIAYTLEPISKEAPAVMDPALVSLLANTAKEEGFAAIHMPSGAGHDSMHWADYAPTGMLFIPCRDGISHNPAEHAKLEDIVAGVRTLEKAVRTLSQKAYALS